MKIQSQLICVVLFLLIFTSCEFSDTSEATIPSYVCINDFTFVTDSSATNYQGRNTCDFPDMWITETGNLLGAVGMPVLLPVRKTGAAKISVDAGVKLSGQDDHRGAYPFVSTYNENITLSAKHIDTIRPVFKYLTNTKFKLIVDNDRPNTSRGFDMNPTYTPQGDTIISVNDNEGREPNNSYIKVLAAASSQTFQMITHDEFFLPNNGAPVFLEMDYKSDMQLEIGYYYQEPNQPSSTATAVISLYPSSTWKKLYLNLTQETSPRKAGTAFQFYIGYANGSGAVPNVSLDNIKLLSLE